MDIPGLEMVVGGGGSEEGLWVDVFQWVREEDFNTIWRKEREVDVPKEIPDQKHWVVVKISGKDRGQLTTLHHACEAARAMCLDGGDGTEYAVARIEKTFKCVTEVVERTVI